MADLIVRKNYNLIDPETGAAAQAQNANWRQVGDDIEALQAAGLLVPVLPHASGRIYGTFGSGISFSLVADSLYTTPFFIPAAGSYDQQGFVLLATASGKLVRLGIYADSGGLPGALLLDSGTVDAGVTGSKARAITFAGAAGWVHLALHIEAGITVTRVNVAGDASRGLQSYGAPGTTFDVAGSGSFRFVSLPFASGLPADLSILTPTEIAGIAIGQGMRKL